MHKLAETLTFTLTVVTAFATAACTDDGTTTAELTACGGADVITPDGEVVEEERFDFAKLNERIAADPSLAELTGVTDVATCDDARTLQQKLRDHVEADVPPPGMTAKVKGANAVNSKRGVVSIERRNSAGDLKHICTGFFLNENIIVTAAHCLPNSSGTRRYTIQYFDPDTGGKRRVTAVDEVLEYRQFPDYDGTGDSEHDTGILVRATTWDGTGDADFMRIYHDFGSRIGELRVWGAGMDGFHGDGAGDLEWANFDLDWHENDYVITRGSRTQRMCKGDSGGPAVRISDGVDLVVATNTSGDYDRDSNGNCSCEDCKQRHTRVYNKLSWIRQTAGAILGRTVTCTSGTAGGLDYDKCF